MEEDQIIEDHKMNYWVFKANSEHYRIDERLLDPAPQITWAVTRYHERIQQGDTVFIWRTGTPRGICAVMVIDLFPYEPEDIDLHDGYEIVTGANSTVSAPHWAKGTFIRRFPVIETNIIKKIPGLELFSFFAAFQQAVNFSITRPEGSILLEFIEKYLAAGPEIKKVSKPATKPKKAAPIRVTTSTKKTKLPASESELPTTVLLQCEACNRYVVSTDTDRHIREAHAGELMEWKKTK
ncbi:MAG: EVE domain-containing protein [Chloroflexi bacterium]|nr:EVE domain-containing protein [Chloroflexota bacterium]